MADKPSDLVQGTLDMLILKTLALEPMHGYGKQQARQVLRLNGAGTPAAQHGKTGMGETGSGHRENFGGVLVMSLGRNITSGLRSLLRRKQADHELNEELSGFLEMAAEEKIKQGMSRKEARRAV